MHVVILSVSLFQLAYALLNGFLNSSTVFFNRLLKLYHLISRIPSMLCSLFNPFKSYHVVCIIYFLKCLLILHINLTLWWSHVLKHFLDLIPYSSIPKHTTLRPTELVLTLNSFKCNGHNFKIIGVALSIKIGPSCRMIIR